MRSNEDLKAESLLIPAQDATFDQQALSLKALATPLLGVGLKEAARALSLEALTTPLLRVRAAASKAVSTARRRPAPVDVEERRTAPAGTALLSCRSVAV